MIIEKIIDKIEGGELNRDMDETGADGFWDLSKELVNERGILVVEEEMSKSERVYNALWSLYEQLIKKKERELKGEIIEAEEILRNEHGVDADEIRDLENTVEFDAGFEQGLKHARRILRGE